MSDNNAECEFEESIANRSNSFSGIIMMDTFPEYPPMEDSEGVKREHDLSGETAKRQKIDEEIIINAETSNSQDNQFIKTAGQTKDTEENSTVEELTKKLPLDELLLLFSWLPAEDLVTAKRVCHSWREAAQEKCLWKTHVLSVLGGTPEDERNVKLMSAVKTIDGWASNSFLNIILENMNEISNLNVDFEPPLSSSQVELILEKYPELESISLCSCEPDILKSLKNLKASKYLKEILFFTVCFSHKKCASSSATNIFKMFTDCNNFPALTAFNILDNYVFTNAFESDVSFRNVVGDVITKRSQQLLSLTLDIQNDDCSGIFNAISSCVKLQRLDIVNVPLNAYMNIERLSKLKSLCLFSSKEGGSFKTSIQKSFERGSWSYLTKVEITLTNSKSERNVPVLKTVIDNAKQIRILEYTDLQQLVSEHELEGIGGLLKLKNLSVIGFENISKLVTGYVSECHSLKSLRLDSRNSDIATKDSCITEMLLKLNDLEYLFICDHYENDDYYNREFGQIFIRLRGRMDIERHISRTSSHT